MRKCAIPVPIIDQFGCFFLFFCFTFSPQSTQTPLPAHRKWAHSTDITVKSYSNIFQQNTGRTRTKCRFAWDLRHTATCSVTLDTEAPTHKHHNIQKAAPCFYVLEASKHRKPRAYESTVPKYAHRTDSTRTMVWTDWKHGSVTTQRQSAGTTQHQRKLVKGLSCQLLNKLS